jgi:glycosyltransferase involved in cell wall biosynthesis
MKALGFLRFLGEYGVSPVSYYRVGLPLKALDEFTKHEAVTYDQIGLYNMFSMALKEGMDPAETITGYDVYVISRLYRDDGAEEYIEDVHSRGGMVVFDTDDDLTEEYRHLDGRGDEFSNMLSRVDLVTVSTPYLANRMEKYAGHRPVVLPNHVDFGWFAQSSLLREKQHPGLNVGVIGTQTHYDDWKCLEEPFARLSEEYDVNVLTAGFEPDYLEQYTHIEGVPYKVYPQLMREFDIVCCALDPEDGFNLSKSAIKALEAMASARRLSNGKIGGAVPVCTDMTLYRRAVNDGHNGVLVDNDGWYEALKALIEDEKTRNRIAYQGHKWVRDNRDIRDGYRLWKRAYLDLLEGRNGKH